MNRSTIKTTTTANLIVIEGYHYCERCGREVAEEIATDGAIDLDVYTVEEEIKLQAEYGNAPLALVCNNCEAVLASEELVARVRQS
jgi:hypothetical protein